MSEANFRYFSGVDCTYTAPKTKTSSGVRDSTIFAMALPLRIVAICSSFKPTYSRKNLKGSPSCPLALAPAERVKKPARIQSRNRVLVLRGCVMVPQSRRSAGRTFQFSVRQKVSEACLPQVGLGVVVGGTSMTHIGN